MMKVAVTSRGGSQDSIVDQRFHLARYALVYDTDTDEWDVAGGNETGKGWNLAGPICRINAEAVLTGCIDRASFKLINEYGGKIYVVPAVTVREAVQLFLAGRLPAMLAPNALDVKMLKKGLALKS